ncbi:MAG: tetratricopeptide repeat protein [Cyanobacteria bacterium J06643_13]
MNQIAGIIPETSTLVEIQALDIAIPHLSNVATSLNNLAELYRLQGRYEDAEPFHLQALE